MTKKSRLLIIISTLLYILCSTPCYAQNLWKELNTSVEQSGYDQVIHVGIGAGVTYAIFKLTDLPVYQKVILSLVGSLAIGYVKELTDKNFDSDDLVGYGIGSSVMCVFNF